MNRYNLSKRLSKVVNLVEPAAFLVDIGCDHGFVSIDLVSSGKVKRALCTDINEGPLERAKTHIKEYGLEDKISTLLSDGLLSIVNNTDSLDPPDYDFDSACICGMGGLMGIKIIFEADMLFRKMNIFYLQLQSDLELVRLFLDKFGYEILFEDLVFEDGKYYTAMKVRSCREPDINTDGFDVIPSKLKDAYDCLSVEECVDLKYPHYDGMDEEVYKAFLDFMINKYETIQNYLPDNSDRTEAIEKELAIMHAAYDKYVKQ
ncbi:MAG: SAM-dependent methyltransferase [Lachnospiraceae bacterium]|nr:SAM-dependent methyltransferase [Lachnospiraceae bacterium]